MCVHLYPRDVIILTYTNGLSSLRLRLQTNSKMVKNRPHLDLVAHPLIKQMQSKVTHFYFEFVHVFTKQTLNTRKTRTEYTQHQVAILWTKGLMKGG